MSSSSDEPRPHSAAPDPAPSPAPAEVGPEAALAAASDDRPSFAALGLPPPLLDAVRELGFEAPTPIQQATIPPLLAGADLIGRARTGSGKTAAFGLPLLAKVAAKAADHPEDRAVRALVLTPTRELALQVTDALRALAEGLPLRLLTVYGGAPYAPQLRGLSRGAAVVVGTPGRLVDLLDRGALDLSAVGFVVLDEADEMLAMGFLDDVERLLASAPVERQTALFSATMPPAIRRIAQTRLRDPVQISLDGGRPATDHIAQRWMAVPPQHKAEALWRLLSAEPAEATLVFCRTRAGCDDVVRVLADHGVSALALHGDLAQPAREAVLAQLRDERVRVVVATDVAARGLDVEHLGHVVNFDLPDNSEVYVHRVGRTGRAGRPGKATSLVSSSHWQRFLGLAQHLGADIDEIRPPSDATIAEVQRAALLEGILSAGGAASVVAAEDASLADGGTESEVGSATEALAEPAAAFDAARLAVARRWIDQASEECGLPVAELAALALVRVADLLGVALVADIGPSLPAWTADQLSPRHLRGGRLLPPAKRAAADPHVTPRPQAGPKADPRAAAMDPRPAGVATASAARRGERAAEGRSAAADGSGARPARAGRHDEGSERGVAPIREQRQAPVGTRAGDEDHVELFLPVGANRRVTPADLVGAITAAAGIPGRDIGRIRILEKISFVAMHERAARLVLERVESVQIRGMVVAVLPSRTR